MAIQMRRGIFSKFDPSRMVAGEWAIVVNGVKDAVNGQAAYICFAPGVVKRVATVDDMAGIIANASQDIADSIMKLATDTNEAIKLAEQKRVAAENGRVDAAREMASATDAANKAADEANKAAEAANSAVTADRKVWLDYDDEGYISAFEVES